MRCIVVDDDPTQRNILESFIKEVDSLEFFGSYDEPTKALNVIQSNEIGLLFLDVEFPNMNGLDLIKSLSNLPQVILATSYEKYAVHAFDFDVTDYLVKPIEFPRFLKAVNKAIERSKNLSELYKDDYDLFVKDGSDLVKINTKDILYINALSDYVKIVTKIKEIAILSTMKNIFVKLPDDKFMRVHRSYIVRISKIDKISDHIIEIDKQLIPVSKSYREELYVKLNLLR